MVVFMNPSRCDRWRLAFGGCEPRSASIIRPALAPGRGIAPGAPSGVVPVMSKLKTRRSAAKRFRFTGTGKVVRNHAYHRHNLTGQPQKRQDAPAQARPGRGGRRQDDRAACCRTAARQSSLTWIPRAMARIKRGVTAKARHKEVLAQAKGYRGRSKNCYRAGAAAGREGAAVRLPRPTQPQARFSRAVDPADQRRGTLGRA